MVDLTNMVKLTGESASLWVPKEKYAASMQLAKEILGGENNLGYLHSYDRGIIKRFYYKQEPLHGRYGPISLEKVNQRIEEFKNAGVPPIFVGDLETPQKFFGFPNLDYILGAVSNYYFEQRAKIGAAKALKSGKKAKNIKVPAVRPYDVDFFKQHVLNDVKFHENSMADLVLREVDYIISEKMDINSEEKREEIRSYTHMGFEHLNLELVDYTPKIDCEVKYYPELFGKSTTEFKKALRKRFWYLGLDPEKIESVLQKTKELIGSGAVKNGETIKKMQKIFPGYFGTDPLHTVITEKIKFALKTGDFGSVPTMAFVDSKYEFAKEALVEMVVTKGEQLYVDDSTQFFQNRTKVAKNLGLPSKLFSHPSVRAIIDSYRLSALEELTDREFLAVFDGRGRVSRLGDDQFNPFTSQGREFRMKMLERFRTLGRTKKSRSPLV